MTHSKLFQELSRLSYNYNQAHKTPLMNLTFRLTWRKKSYPLPTGCVPVRNDLFQGGQLLSISQTTCLDVNVVPNLALQQIRRAFSKSSMVILLEIWYKSSRACSPEASSSLIITGSLRSSEIYRNQGVWDKEMDMCWATRERQVSPSTLFLLLISLLGSTERKVKSTMLQSWEISPTNLFPK